jgi:hypothetical protein
MASAFAVRESESGAPRTFESTPTAGSDGFPDRGLSGSRPIRIEAHPDRGPYGDECPQRVPCISEVSPSTGAIPGVNSPPFQRPHPLRPHADPDEPGGQPPRKRDMNEQPHDPRRLDFAGAAEDALSPPAKPRLSWQTFPCVCPSVAGTPPLSAISLCHTTCFAPLVVET